MLTDFIRSEAGVETYVQDLHRIESKLMTVAAVLAALGMVAVLLAWKGKLPAKAGALIAFALMLAGVAAARYAFYAASIL